MNKLENTAKPPQTREEIRTQVQLQTVARIEGLSGLAWIGV